VCAHARTKARTRRRTIAEDDPKLIQLDLDAAFKVRTSQLDLPTALCSCNVDPQGRHEVRWGAKPAFVSH